MSGAVLAGVVGGTDLAWAYFSQKPAPETNAFGAGSLSAPGTPTTIHPAVTGSGDGDVSISWSANLTHAATFLVQRAPASTPSSWSTVNGGGSGQASSALCTGSVPGTVSCNYLDSAPTSTSAPVYGQQYVYQVVATIGAWSATSGGDLAQSLAPVSGSETYLQVPDLNDVSAQSATAVWAVGQACTVLFSAGSGWTQQTVPTSVCPSGTTLDGVAADGGNPMVVGANGVTFICTASCTSGAPSWSAKSTAALGSPTLESVSAQSSTAMWAVGPNCSALYFNGTAWSSLAVPTTVCATGTTLNSVANNSGKPIVAGNAKTLFLCSGGCNAASPTWNAMTVSGLAGSPDFYATSVTGGNAWVVGSSGTVVTCTGGCGGGGATWALQVSSTANDLQGVWAQAANVVYAVGAGGVVVKCTTSCNKSGTQWTAVSSGTTSALDAVTVPTATAAWAVGPGGAVDAMSGSTWSVQASGLGASVPAQHSLSSSEVAAVSSPDASLYTGQAPWPAGTLPATCGSTTPSLALQAAPTVPAGTWSITGVVAALILQANATPGPGAGFALLVSGDAGSTWASYALASPGTAGAPVTTSVAIGATVASSTALANLRLCLVGTSGSGTALTTSVDLVHLDVD